MKGFMAVCKRSPLSKWLLCLSCSGCCQFVLQVWYRSVPGWHRAIYVPCLQCFLYEPLQVHFSGKGFHCYVGLYLRLTLCWLKWTQEEIQSKTLYTYLKGSLHTWRFPPSFSGKYSKLFGAEIAFCAVFVWWDPGPLQVATIQMESRPDSHLH